MVSSWAEGSNIFMRNVMRNNTGDEWVPHSLMYFLGIPAFVVLLYFLIAGAFGYYYFIHDSTYT